MRVRHIICAYPLICEYVFPNEMHVLLTVVIKVRKFNIDTNLLLICHPYSNFVSCPHNVLYSLFSNLDSSPASCILVDRCTGDSQSWVEVKEEGGDRGNLVEKKESPKRERAVKPVISLPSKNGY